jgi:hypothetical protein
VVEIGDGVQSHLFLNRFGAERNPLGAKSPNTRSLKVIALSVFVLRTISSENRRPLCGNAALRVRIMR